MVTSNELMKTAISIIKECPTLENHWAIGGGTVLADYFHHRLSKDIDVFVDDIQLLGALSPRFNDVSDNAMYYDEEDRFISLTFSQGKIDFIASSQITCFPSVTRSFMGFKAPLEDPVEIVCKKCIFEVSMLYQETFLT